MSDRRAKAPTIDIRTGRPIGDEPPPPNGPDDYGEPTQEMVVKEATIAPFALRSPSKTIRRI
jgi:hypothetical protein